MLPCMALTWHDIANDPASCVITKVFSDYNVIKISASEMTILLVEIMYTKPAGEIIKGH